WQGRLRSDRNLADGDRYFFGRGAQHQLPKRVHAASNAGLQDAAVVKHIDVLAGQGIDTGIALGDGIKAVGRDVVQAVIPGRGDARYQVDGGSSGGARVVARDLGPIGNLPVQGLAKGPCVVQVHAHADNGHIVVVG